MTKAAQLLDAILREKNIKSDAALAVALEVDPPNISRLRRTEREMGPTMIVRIHELMGWSIRDIKAILGMKCLPSHLPA